MAIFQVFMWVRQWSSELLKETWQFLAIAAAVFLPLRTPTNVVNACLDPAVYL